MSLWIPVTIAATLIQTIRFMLQKQLKSAGLSTGGAAFSRFVFGAPLAISVSAIALMLTDTELPELTLGFWGYVLAGGLAQIIATHMTVSLMAMRNFAVGLAFIKTETVLVALMAIVLLGERISGPGWLAIFVGLAGVIMLSKRAEGGSWLSRTTVHGLVAGGLFGYSAICYRGAAIELGEAPAFVRSMITLACVTTSQTIGMGLWMRVFETGELTKVFASWRKTILVGVTGMLGSLFWFYAFALENAAYVRALGQVEMVFTLLVSYFVFREKLSSREGIGISLICVSVLMLVLLL